jgi:hypothetical protein
VTSIAGARHLGHGCFSGLRRDDRPAQQAADPTAGRRSGGSCGLCSAQGRLLSVPRAVLSDHRGGCPAARTGSVRGRVHARRSAPERGAPGPPVRRDFSPT